MEGGSRALARKPAGSRFPSTVIFLLDNRAAYGRDHHKLVVKGCVNRRCFLCTGVGRTLKYWALRACHCHAILCVACSTSESVL